MTIMSNMPWTQIGILAAVIGMFLAVLLVAIYEVDIYLSQDMEDDDED